MDEVVVKDTGIFFYFFIFFCDHSGQELRIIEYPKLIGNYNNQQVQYRSTGMAIWSQIIGSFCLDSARYSDCLLSMSHLPL